MSLNLIEIRTAHKRQPFWYALNPFHGELRLHEGTLDEIVRKTADPHGLILRHGLPRTLAFYQERVEPVLARIPASPDVWQVRYETAAQVVQMLAATQETRSFIKLIATLVRQLARARFADNEKANTEARRQIKTFLRIQLTRALNSTLAQEHGVLARQAYQLCEQVGGLTPAQRATYAELLWRAGDRSPAAMRVYLRHLSEHDGTNNRHDMQAMREFVAAQLTIDEQLSPQELNQRVIYNKFALCGPKPPPLAARHAGLGYLRLGQPKRAVASLRRPRPGAHADGGDTAFYLGQALFQLGEYDGAAESFERATSDGYSPARTASWQGVAYAKLRRWDKAVQTFRVAEQEPGIALDSEFYLQWGRASFLMKDTAESVQRFQQALAQDAQNWRAAYGLAVCLEQQERGAEAMELLRAVAAEHKDAAPVFHFLGRLLEAAGQKIEACAWYRQAVAVCPNDTEYLLSLGLMLNDLGDAAGLPVLEQVARAHVGGVEVLRRLAVGYLQAGERTRGRHWLRALAAADRANPTVALFNARDHASVATEAFNARRYQEALAQWEEIERTWSPNLPASGEIRRRLALALTYNAAARFAAGEGDDIWALVERAQALAPQPESRFLSSISRLVHSDFHAAEQSFAELATEYPARAEYQFFCCLSASFTGDAGALAQLAQLGPLAGAANLNSLLAFLQVQFAAQTGDFTRAVEHIKAWVAEPAAVRELGLPPAQINVLVALCLTRGTRQKKQQIIRFLEDRNANYGDGYWDLALALAGHHIATAGGVANAGLADVAKLNECAAAYESLLDKAAPAERDTIIGHYARLLRFIICQRVGASDIGGALATLDKLAALPLALPCEVQALRGLLGERLAAPSHEKAYALLHSDPDGARAVWQELLRRNEDDHIAVQHLACLAWARAYDEVVAKHYDESLPFWQEGLDWYQRLYNRADFWTHLRERGRLLGQMPGYPFNEQLFDQWRAEALYRRARTLLDLITHLMAGYDPATHSGSSGPQVRVARLLMEVIRKSQLPA
jgi:tetratricopeptide (TPR) repeat protein